MVFVTVNPILDVPDTDVTVPVLVVYPDGLVALYGVNPNAVVTSEEDNVTAPVLVLNEVTPP